jgi:hypothetical protein
MSRISTLCAAVPALAVSVASPAIAQDISVSVNVSTTRSFVPLQSYYVGKTSNSMLFFGGLTDMGLHEFSSGAFPFKKFSNQIVLVNKASGAVTTASISHLPQAVREAIMVVAGTSVQYGTVLSKYGGYGPMNAGANYGTRDSVLSIDLAAVEAAILASNPVPTSAFTLAISAEAQVAGAGIVKMSDGNRFALICGANADGEYPHQGDPLYSEEIHIFDRTVSMTTPVQTFLGEDFGHQHRRDVNVAPVTLPAGGGGARDGFVVVCGVFQNGIFPWENPLIWGDGDAEVFVDWSFVQHIGGYEGPMASLYSALADRNHILAMSGLSAYEFTDGEFFWNPAAPWTQEVSQITIDSGVFTNETVVGQMPWPVTNAHLIIEESLPKNAQGQVLMDDLMCNVPVLLGRIYGGIAAESEGDAPPTYASDDVYEVWLKVVGDESVQPASFSRVRGLPGSGGLADLLATDDARLVTRPDVFGPAPINNPAVQIRVNGNAALTNPSRFCVTIEARASRANILQRVLLLNRVTQTWELKQQLVLPQTDTFREVEIAANASEYIDQTSGEVSLLIQHVAASFSVSPAWTAGIDQVVWTFFE